MFMLEVRNPFTALQRTFTWSWSYRRCISTRDCNHPLKFHFLFFEKFFIQYSMRQWWLRLWRKHDTVVKYFFFSSRCTHQNNGLCRRGVLLCLLAGRKLILKIPFREYRKKDKKKFKMRQKQMQIDQKYYTEDTRYHS